MAEDENDKKDENDKTVIPAERFTSEPDNSIDNSPESSPVNPESPLIINGQYIKDLSFEAPNVPDVFVLIQNDVPDIEVNIDVEANPKEDRLFEVALTVRAESKIKEKLVYLCEVEYAGLFTINVSQEHLGLILLIECPLILFPYMRRIVSDLTTDGGFAPLMLAPIDFAALYQQRMAVTQNQTENDKTDGVPNQTKT